MRIDKLLAKSPRDGREITLVEHTRHVIEAAEALFGSDSQPTQMGRCWLRFFNLGEDAWPTFRDNLIAACALHDWGKANDGFQAAVRGNSDAQAIRHEHLSALLIGSPQVTTWLHGNKLLDVPLILSAVMTHHLKAAFDPCKKYGFAAAENGRKQFQFLRGHSDFGEFIVEVADRFHLGALDLSQVPEIWGFDKPLANVRDLRERIKDQLLEPLRRDFDAKNVRSRMLLAVRAALIAADAAGSGLIRVGKTIRGWVSETFEAHSQWNGQSVWEEIIQRRIDSLDVQFSKLNKPPFKWNDFQIACEQLPVRALLLAPCGSGKTLAAWRWIAARAAEKPVGRVLFLYPTRATAKEGFKDYVSWAPESDAALMHGTAAFDLCGMFDNEADPRHGLSYEADRRLFALGFWSKRAFSATVDQFLAFLQYGYGPVCMLPVLADSVVVIDEVHSFDRNMFSALKAFLKHFDVPVLCMTATLPNDRREQLEAECSLKVYEDKPGELRTIADMPRYQLSRAVSRDAVVARVQDALAAGQRVLWVVNTVARCHEIVAKFAVGFVPTSTKDSKLWTACGKPVYCYHSRFKLTDRVERHKDVLENLKAASPAGIGVTTQVCEMSLDLDVDLLVTEECPVTSLIQRMGRCNRDRQARPLDHSGEVIIYEPADHNPYSPEDLTGLSQFLGLVAGKELSQSALEAALGAVESPPRGGDRLSMFLESGPYAVAGEEEFRDSEDHNRQCVLFDEVTAYLAAKPDAKPGFVLPIPRRLSRARDDAKHPEHRQLPTHLGVAAAGHYHPAIGFYDRPLDQWGVD